MIPVEPGAHGVGLHVPDAPDPVQRRERSGPRRGDEVVRRPSELGGYAVERPQLRQESVGHGRLRLDAW